MRPLGHSPAVPATLDTDGLVLMLQALYDIGTDRYRVLLTKVPPPPEPDGPQLRTALTAQSVPLFAVDIPRLKAFEKAAAAGVPVSAVDDRHAHARMGSIRSCRKGTRKLCLRK